MAKEECVHSRQCKTPGTDRRRQASPPSRPLAALVKQHASELPRIAENEGVPALPEDEMIVLAGTHSGFIHPQFAGHPQMNAQPSALGELEEQLFAVGGGLDKGRTGKGRLQVFDRHAAENTRLRMKFDRDHPPL